MIGAQVGIKEISVPGVSASRMIVAPRAPVADPAAVVLAKAQPQPSSCMLTTQRWVCSPDLATSTEEQYGFDQGFSTPSGYRATVRGSAVLVSPALVTRYLQLIPGQARVGASSRYTRDPQDQPWSAFDGNPATTWVASPIDANPALSITWQRPRTVRKVTIQRPPGASGPLQVLLAGDRGQARGGMVGPGGVLRFAPMRTSKLRFLFTTEQEPLQISNIVIPGVPPLTTPSGPFRLRCGLGPDIELNGKVLPTQVSGTFADLLTGRPMQFTACSGVLVASGTNRVVESARDAFDVQDVVLARSGGVLSDAHAAAGSGGGTPGGQAPGEAAGSGSGTRRDRATGGAAGLGGGTRGRRALAAATAPPTTGASVVVRSWTPSRRVVSVTSPARSYLVVNENFNAGWQARLGGTRLRAVRIDGWKQAWLLPAGTAGTVTLTYPPSTLYQDAITGGLGTVALVMLVALWPAPGRARGRSWRPRWLVLPRRSREGEQTRLATPAVQARRVRPGWLRKPVRSRPGWGAVLPSAAAGCGLLLAGLWLGGYPGAAILVATACLFTAAVRHRPGHRIWLELSRPWLVAGLLLAAAACGVVGGQLLAAGASGPLVTALTSTVPQVICLAIVGRVAAALFAGEP